MVFVRCLHLLALAVWVGSIVFLSFVVAPSIFGAFPETQRSEAGRIMATIFPGYYRVGAGCGLVLLATSLLLWWVDQERGAWAVSGGVTAVMLAATLYAGWSVQPRAHALRTDLRAAPEDVVRKAEFDRLHRLAVQLNVVVLLGGLVVLGAAAGRLRG